MISPPATVAITAATVAIMVVFVATILVNNTSAWYSDGAIVVYIVAAIVSAAATVDPTVATSATATAATVPNKKYLNDLQNAGKKVVKFQQKVKDAKKQLNNVLKGGNQNILDMTRGNLLKAQEDLEKATSKLKTLQEQDPDAFVKRLNSQAEDKLKSFQEPSGKGFRFSTANQPTLSHKDVDRLLQEFVKTLRPGTIFKLLGEDQKQMCDFIAQNSGLPITGEDLASFFRMKAKEMSKYSGEVLNTSNAAECGDLRQKIIRLWMQNEQHGILGIVSEAKVTPFQALEVIISNHLIDNAEAGKPKEKFGNAAEQKANKKANKKANEKAKQKAKAVLREVVSYLSKKERGETTPEDTQSVETTLGDILPEGEYQRVFQAISMGKEYDSHTCPVEDEAKRVKAKEFESELVGFLAKLGLVYGIDFFTEEDFEGCLVTPDIYFTNLRYTLFIDGSSESFRWLDAKRTSFSSSDQGCRDAILKQGGKYLHYFGNGALVYSGAIVGLDDVQPIPGVYILKKDTLKTAPL